MNKELLSQFVRVCGSKSEAATEFRWMIEHLLAKRHRSFFKHSASLPPETLAAINGLHKHHEWNLNDQSSLFLKDLSPQEIHVLLGYVNARCIGKPLQYILGNQSFLGVNLLVKRPVLIPRWETEEWTERLIGLLQPKARILEIGTGSGCISIAIGRAMPGAFITAIDISRKALNLAEINRRRNRVNNVRIQYGDIMDDEFVSSLEKETKFDVIVSNPPYISPEEQLDKSVVEWEDHQALFTTDTNGTQFYSRIAQISHRLLSAQSEMPSLALEIGESQGDRVRALYSNFKTQIWTDMAGRHRTVVAFR
jgi:release factor glutamine methyltransferase